MEVTVISDLLGRYQALLPQGRVLNQVVEDSLRACGEVSPITRARMQGNTLFVTAHPTIKQYIYLNKEKIKRLVNEKSKLLVSDIV